MPTFIMELKRMPMSLIEKIFGKKHKHQWIIRYDERNDLDDDKTHTFKVTLCEECGEVKSIEELQ